MKISDLIRQVADVVDAQEEQSAKQTELAQAAQQAEISNAVQDSQDLQAGQIAQLVQAAQNAKQAAAQQSDGASEYTVLPSEMPSTEELTPVDNTDDTAGETMVPPLQQKHELLKKATGVENNTDEFVDDDDAELAKMVQMAGINNLPQVNQEVEINPRKNAALLHFSTDNVEVE